MMVTMESKTPLVRDVSRAGMDAAIGSITAVLVSV